MVAGPFAASDFGKPICHLPVISMGEVLGARGNQRRRPKRPRTPPRGGAWPQFESTVGSRMTKVLGSHNFSITWARQPRRLGIACVRSRLARNGRHAGCRRSSSGQTPAVTFLSFPASAGCNRSSSGQKPAVKFLSFTASAGCNRSSSGQKPAVTILSFTASAQRATVPRLRCDSRESHCTRWAKRPHTGSQNCHRNPWRL